uniref:FERM domain-containing protein n=1 Tax=Syphacia muris TaxID=451379 RepID=A0A0N5A9N7_9BILA
LTFILKNSEFYPPDPTLLTDDVASHLIYLQICRDLNMERLPVSMLSCALLGSFIAQIEMGEFDSSNDYTALIDRHSFMKPFSKIAEKIKDLHKQHRGKTPSEAETCFLDTAKRLALYGIEFFAAKSSKGYPVRIGISAHGIDIYREQIRLHRFLWQNIVKIAFHWNVFEIKLRHGESFKNIKDKTNNYDSAKRVWKCAVEYHTFFRLIQPDEKPHKKLFRWGSARFRYQGRTQFQSKMASQMFDHPSATLPRDQSLNLPYESQSRKIFFLCFLKGIQTVEASQQLLTPVGEAAVTNEATPIIETHSHVVSYESTDPVIDEYDMSDLPGELISSRTITSGNRTFETVTYKTEKNGIVETHVEHRVTIHSKGDIDHDAELCQAILEATDMNPDMTVEKIEVRQESQS